MISGEGTRGYATWREANRDARFTHTMENGNRTLELCRRELICVSYTTWSSDIPYLVYQQVVLCGSEDIAGRAIELLKETFTNLGPRLQGNRVIIHDDFLSSCMSRLKVRGWQWIKVANTYIYILIFTYKFWSIVELHLNIGKLCWAEKYPI